MHDWFGYCLWDYYASMEVVHKHDNEFVMGSPFMVNSQLFITAGISLALRFLNSHNTHITATQV
jgi:hypothetical protein